MEKETIYYDLVYQIVINDKYFHKETLDPMHYIARAGNLKKLGLFQLTLRDYKQGMECLGSFPQELAIACMDAGMLLNLLGDYEFGWQLYEKRWESNYKSFQNPIIFPRPRWNGEDISQGRLLIHSEQGIGDNIQFIRYAIYLKQQGLDVLVWNNEHIDDFLSFNLAKYGIATAKGGDEVQFSHWIPMMSLPAILETRLDNIPYTTSYLFSENSYLQKWRKKLPLNKFKIGVAWRGGAATDVDKIRSIPLEIFSHLFSLNADFHVLQKDINDNEQSILAIFNNVYDWHNDIDNFFDTSAIIDQMDLVICVDTSVAHLAAAMGKPTWILINYSPDFRWLLNREDSVWYDSVRLFRQDLDYDWKSVIDSVLSTYAIKYF
ncbi:glycosyltransferase family 9 protein [Pasteurellaceae bacterium 22721_9_1]